MTNEELAEIRERAETALNMGSIAWESAGGVQVLWTIFKEDIPKLLAEVERLQAKCDRAAEEHLQHIARGCKECLDYWSADLM